MDNNKAAMEIVEVPWNLKLHPSPTRLGRATIGFPACLLNSGLVFHSKFRRPAAPIRSTLPLLLRCSPQREQAPSPLRGSPQFEHRTCVVFGSVAAALSAAFASAKLTLHM